MASRNPLYKKNALITSGPTWVPIDTVRVISNQSTGQMGALIAKGLRREGASVTLLEGPVTKGVRSKDVVVKKFKFYDELFGLMQVELKKPYDIVIHAAAVSDYWVKNPYGKKLSSEFSEIKLTLIPTPKIIENIKKLNKKVFLVGFKLESQTQKELMMVKTQQLFRDARCDLVVANSLDNDSYSALIIDKKKKLVNQCASKKETVAALIDELKNRLDT